MFQISLFKRLKSCYCSTMHVSLIKQKTYITNSYFWLWHFSDSPWCLWPWRFWEVPVRYFVKWSQSLDLSNVFLMIRLQLLDLVRKYIKIKCHLYHIISRVQVINRILHCCNDLDLAQVVVFKFLHCKVLFFFLYSFSKCTLRNERGIMVYYLEGGVYSYAIWNYFAQENICLFSVN